ncbi:MAG: hypothetical protein AB7P04_08815 [Bacteriovoracia bacterium]
MKKQKVFLGAQGKVHGPYSVEQLNEMQRSGRIKDYSWIWDFQKETWSHLDPAPPALTEAQLGAALMEEMPEAPVHHLHQKAPEPAAMPAPRAIPITSLAKNLQAVCFHQTAAVSGMLAGMTQLGCELVSLDRSPSPQLGRNQPLMLNVLDPKSGRTVNVQARMHDAKRSEAGWTYLLQWKQVPDFRASA